MSKVDQAQIDELYKFIESFRKHYMASNFTSYQWKLIADRGKDYLPYLLSVPPRRLHMPIDYLNMTPPMTVYWTHHIGRSLRKMNWEIMCVYCYIKDLLINYPKSKTLIDEAYQVYFMVMYDFSYRIIKSKMRRTYRTPDIIQFLEYMAEELVILTLSDKLLIRNMQQLVYKSLYPQIRTSYLGHLGSEISWVVKKPLQNTYLIDPELNYSLSLMSSKTPSEYIPGRRIQYEDNYQKLTTIGSDTCRDIVKYYSIFTLRSDIGQKLYKSLLISMNLGYPVAYNMDSRYTDYIQVLMNKYDSVVTSTLRGFALEDETIQEFFNISNNDYTSNTDGMSIHER